MSVSYSLVEAIADDGGADASSREHVIAELARIEAIVQAAVAAVSSARTGATQGAPDDGEPAAAARMTATAQARLTASLFRGSPLRLELLRSRFGLTDLDVDLLLLGLLPELYGKYVRLYRFLGGDGGRGLTFEVALSLLCTSYEERIAGIRRLAEDGPLVHHGLVQVSEEADEVEPRSCRSWRVDERVVAFLLHDVDTIDARIESYAEQVAPRLQLGDLLLPTETTRRLARWLEQQGAGAPRGGLVQLAGPAGGGKTAVAEALCHGLGMRLLVVRGEELLALPPEGRAGAVRLVLREARLLDAAVCWEGSDPLQTEARLADRKLLLRALRAEGRLAFLCAESLWETGDEAAWRLLQVELPHPDAASQAELWRRALAEGAEPSRAAAAAAAAVDRDLLVSRHRLTGGRIRAAVSAGRARASSRQPGAHPGTDELLDACRRQSQPKLGTLARRVTSSTTWHDLVLSRDRTDVLRQVCAHARHRNRVLDDWGFAARLPTGQGLSLLLSGPPGTGKTMAASVMASELGLDLYQIDLSAIVSKYIGETEKQLEQIFREAESSRAILFFDEADALFGKRTEVQDAHDRYANIETSYLLQRMDSYQGMVVLASNWSRNLDEAFVRRLRFVLELAVPEERERLLIWERTWPAQLPRDASVDLSILARRFELAGGYIRNILLAAAFQAASDGGAVTQRHLLRAARAEYRKMGKVMDEAAFRVAATAQEQRS